MNTGILEPLSGKRYCADYTDICSAPTTTMSIYVKNETEQYFSLTNLNDVHDINNESFPKTPRFSTLLPFMYPERKKTGKRRMLERSM